jgi:membrane protein
VAKFLAKDLGKVLAAAFVDFKKNEPLRLAGATAFFTTFALPPILIIIVQLTGTVLRIKNLRDKFLVQLAEIVGKQGASQVKVAFSGFTSLTQNPIITAGVSIFLVFVATTLFKVIKDTLNQLWSIKISTKRPFKANLEKRAVSMIVIFLSGVLLVGGMIARGVGSFLKHQANDAFAGGTATFLNVLINQAISIIIATVWFSMVFKVLPDARTSWRVVFAGGFFTAVLFTIGKVIIRYALLAGNLTNIFGASTAFALLLLFVFYSSFILYYGACFTKAFGDFTRDPIKAGDYSVKFKMVEAGEG